MGLIELDLQIMRKEMGMESEKQWEGLVMYNLTI